MSKKNIQISLVVGTVIVLASSLGAYIYSTANQFSLSQPSTSGTTVGTNQAPANSSNEEAEETKTPVVYAIANLNKKDGDTLSVPDRVTFEVLPSADSSRVRLLFEDGTTIYDKNTSGSKVSIDIYPEKKLTSGSKGTLVIDVLVAGKVVQTKEIKVVF